jgi:predicted membrane protein
MQNTKDKLVYTVTICVTLTLCFSVLAMVVAFMLGLWAKEVDNAEIFKMISPAFSTLIGGMIGFLSGIKLNQDETTDKPKGEKNDGIRCDIEYRRETNRQVNSGPRSEGESAV